jgi:glucose-1-phosphate cytidylyltransferase
MTGGRVRRVKDFVGDGPFMLTYGDGLADVNIAALKEFHASHGRLATVTTVKPTSRFGLVDIGADARVTTFAEKPQVEGWMSAGFFVFDQRVFDYIDGGDDCILERAPLERLTSDGQLVAYRHDGSFFAMDTFREYQQLNKLWDSGQAPWKAWK